MAQWSTFKKQNKTNPRRAASDLGCYLKTVRTSGDLDLTVPWFRSPPFSGAGLATNVLIAFTATSEQEGPALPLRQCRDRSDGGGLISRPDLRPLPALFPSHPESAGGGCSSKRPPAAPHRPQSRHAVGKYSNKRTQGAGKRSRYANFSQASEGEERGRGRGGFGGKRCGKKLGIGCTRTSAHLLAGAEENISHTP